MRRYNECKFRALSAMPLTLRFRPILSPLALSVALIAGAGPALAEKADRDQPMNAEADALRYDDARQTSVFTGNVVITKGTIVIRGAQVEVRQDAQGDQFGVVNGSPAFFRQKRDGVDEFIEGTAQRIEYDSRADTVRFIGNAVLRRLAGSRINDETTGSADRLQQHHRCLHRGRRPQQPHRRQPDRPRARHAHTDAQAR